MPEELTVFPEFVLTFFAAGGFGMLLFCVIASTLTTSLGPTKAYKGKDSASMRMAVTHMKQARAPVQTLSCCRLWPLNSRIAVVLQDQNIIKWVFMIGILFFAIAFLVILWEKLHEVANRILCIVAWVICMSSLAWFWRRTRNRYKFEETKAYVPGKSGVVSGTDYIATVEGADVNDVTTGGIDQPAVPENALA